MIDDPCGGWPTTIITIATALTTARWSSSSISSVLIYNLCCEFWLIDVYLACYIPSLCLGLGPCLWLLHPLCGFAFWHVPKINLMLLPAAFWGESAGIHSVPNICICLDSVCLCACVFRYSCVILTFWHIFKSTQISVKLRRQNLQVIDAAVKICIICFPCRPSHKWCLWSGPASTVRPGNSTCPPACLPGCLPDTIIIPLFSWVHVCLHCLSENGVKCFRIQNLHGWQFLNDVSATLSLSLYLFSLLQLFSLLLWSWLSAWLPFPCVCARALSIFGVCYKAHAKHMTHPMSSGTATPIGPVLPPPTVSKMVGYIKLQHFADAAPKCLPSAAALRAGHWPQKRVGHKKRIAECN